MRSRRRFQHDLAEQVARARRYREHATLLVIDVDGLKQINDAHGHAIGDEALRLTAEALRGRLRETDMLARIGGDEFAVLLLGTDRDPTGSMAVELQGVVGRCAVRPANATPVALAVSVGAVVINQETSSADAALTAADRAMYADKARRRNQTQAPQANR